MASIIGLAFVGLSGLTNFTLRMQSQFKENLIAINLANEAMEAIKAFKEESWSNLSGLVLGTAYHPEQNGLPLKWSIVADQETINNFARQIVLEEVYRDSNDDIVASGGMIDQETRKIIVTVSWSSRGESFQTTLTSYLSNLEP